MAGSLGEPFLRSTSETCFPKRMSFPRLAGGRIVNHLVLLGEYMYLCLVLSFRRGPKPCFPSSPLREWGGGIAWTLPPPEEYLRALWYGSVLYKQIDGYTFLFPVASSIRSNFVFAQPQHIIVLSSVYRPVGNANSRHVCHDPQHSAPSVCISNLRRQSTGSGCPVSNIGREMDVSL